MGTMNEKGWTNPRIILKKKINKPWWYDIVDTDIKRGNTTDQEFSWSLKDD